MAAEAAAAGGSALGPLALIGGGLGLVGSLISGNKQAKAQKEANAINRAIFAYQKETQAPYVAAGQKSLADLMALMQNPESVQDTAGYQFRFGEGQRALENNLAARGQLLGGAALKRLTQYGQGFASNEFQNQFNRLAALSGIGQQASNNLAGFAGQYGANAMNGVTALGNIGASTALGVAGAGTGAINNYLQYDLYSKLMPAGVGATPSAGPMTGSMMG